MKKKLIIVGSGIKSLSHLTRETECTIKEANLVLYLLNEPIIEQWIQVNSNKYESLEDIYFSHSLRSDAYAEISKKIIASLDMFEHLCVVMYGHPIFLCDSISNLTEILRNMLIDFMILPAVSSLDCLFADLKINPSQGFHAVDATDLLLYNNLLCKFNHLIIWQIGLVGVLGNTKSLSNVKSLNILCNKLINFYGPKQCCFIYEASIYPHLQPVIIEIPLERLNQVTISTISTVYIPAETKPQISKSNFKELGMVWE